MFGITGINTVGFSTATNAAGIHKFRLDSKNTLRSVRVLNSGYDSSADMNSDGITNVLDVVQIVNIILN